MKKMNFLGAAAALFASMPAWAQEAAHSAGGDKGLYAIGAGLVLGMAALGGTLGQGKIGASAMDGIARNPQAQKDMFTPMIIALALVESLVVISFVIAFLIQQKF